MTRLIAVSTIYNEADILANTLSHLWAHGVDEIAVAYSTQSRDGTLDILIKNGCNIFMDTEDFHYQPRWINHLIEVVAAPGDWIIPFDADEFHYAIDGRTLKEALEELPPGWCPVASYQQRDWHRRYPHMGMGKVAFRYEHGAAVSNGNHSVELPSRPPAIPDVVALREIQFRSAEHLRRKSRERVDRIDPSLPATEGHHQRVLAPLTDAELTAKWGEWGTETDLIDDPIPLRWRDS